ncbi:S8 family peptidase [Parvularcula oceani]|uniref:S8 family peptidase n=1 Tax=Parvularcula oceani TaxID=1247963 RepID=UPI0004E0D995|nr:S8 family peptidase [Parvularcula oceani]
MKSVLSTGVAALALLSASAGAQEALVAYPAADMGPVGNSSNFAIEAEWGDIEPFWGDIEPFWGDIEPFWGDIDPFGTVDPRWGDIDPFWGDIEPFWGDIDPFGTVDPRWGDIDPFWGDIEPFWGDIEPFWGDIEPFWDGTMDRVFTDDEVSLAAGKLGELFDRAEGVFGQAIEVRTGSAYQDAFVDPLLARYGIDLSEPATLGALSPRARSRFFLDFYDGLMNYSGRDRFDWWMGMVGWSPRLAQEQNSGHRPVIGLIDSTIGAGASTLGRVTYSGGYVDDLDNVATGHGTAVASLIAAPHDWQGTMGMVPNADLAVWNPYDETGTTNWWDVTRGLRKLRREGAHVVNLSLGVEDQVLDQDWAYALSPQMRYDDLVVVKAAGNDGALGKSSFWWNSGANDGLLLVGSVNAAGEISDFSNRPGTACMTGFFGCRPGERLMDHFLVAPGELILTDDGAGGTRRLSGTSMAAPLVTGTVALLQSRWPWLENHAATTAQIVLRSATDLGAPGVDPVYGWGLLNVEAAQSPLSFDALTFRTRPRGGRTIGTQSLRDALITDGLLARLADSEDAVLYAYESVGDTFRDFAIPLSTRVSGTQVTTAGGRQPVQSHLYRRLEDWAMGAGFAEAPVTLTEERPGYSLALTSGVDAQGQQTGSVTLTSEGGLGFTLGAGANAPGSLLFDAARDVSGQAGSVMPVAGFASGGTYAAASMPAGALGALSFAVSANDPHEGRFGFDDDPTRDTFAVEGYEARATSLSLSRPLLGGAFGLSYQRLDEANGVLGTQGAGALSLSGGAVTRAVTAEFAAPEIRGITFGLTATAGMTRAEAQSGVLALAEEGVQSRAFALRASTGTLLRPGDRLTLTASQPLSVTAGAVTLSSYEVTDRQTGERAFVDRTLELGGAVPLLIEADYALPLLPGRVNLSAVTAYEAEREEGQLGLSLSAKF